LSFELFSVDLLCDVLFVFSLGSFYYDIAKSFDHLVDAWGLFEEGSFLDEIGG
jgi:hypothetical protein